MVVIILLCLRFFGAQVIRETPLHSLRLLLNSLQSFLAVSTSRFHGRLNRSYLASFSSLCFRRYTDSLLVGSEQKVADTSALGRALLIESEIWNLKESCRLEGGRLESPPLLWPLKTGEVIHSVWVILAFLLPTVSFLSVAFRFRKSVNM
jgi:hypothetical protein